MSRTNYEAVADFAGHWLHRAQVSLLTGEIGQIKLNHIRNKNPGAGLVRAPRPKPRSRPRSKTEAAEPASLSRSPTDGNLLVCLTHQQAATPVRGCVKHTNPRITEETSPNGRNATKDL